MELSELLGALKKWWFVVATVTAVSAVAAGGYTAMQPPMYTATAQGILSVSNPQTRPPYALANGAQYILDRMTSYAALGVTTPVLTPVVDDLDLDETPLSLSGRIDSQSIVGMAVVEVAATYNDPATAASIADSTITQMGRAISTLEKGNIQMAPTGAAVTPAAPSNQKVLINSAVAAAGGLGLGCLIAVGLGLLTGHRQRRRTPVLS